METFICLQSVPSVPVAATLDENVRPIDLFLNEDLVAEEETNSYYSQNNVDLGPERPSLVENCFVRGDGFVLKVKSALVLQTAM